MSPMPKMRNGRFILPEMEVYYKGFDAGYAQGLEEVRTLTERLKLAVLESNHFDEEWLKKALEPLALNEESEKSVLKWLKQNLELQKKLAEIADLKKKIAELEKL